MLIAFDINGKRIRPEKGKLGFCQLCQEKVRAYCGEINIDHWRHIELNSCDSWNEGETDWHREWKNEFPSNWQEVIIEKNAEIHIADIRTPNNLILELQNSSISPSTIKIRERFYGNMIWLINADKFKKNFRISSMVTSQLRHLDDRHRSLSSYEPQESSELTIATEKLAKLEVKMRKLTYEISNKKSKIDDIENLLKDFKNTVDEFLGSNVFYSSIMNEFESKEKVRLIELKINSKKLYEELVQKEILISQIAKLANCEIENYEHYKHITVKNISSTSYSKCALIEIESEDSFFPTIIKFKSELEFNRMAKNSKFRLIVNPLEKIEKTQNEIVELLSKIEEVSIHQSRTKKEISSSLKKFLKINKNQLSEKLGKLERKKEKIKIKLTSKKYSIDFIKIKDNEKREEELIAMERHHKEKGFEIMKKYKGFYNYNWKHKRKSWEFSNKKIYLDFENAIFKIINEYTLEKMTKEEFIYTVKNL